MQNVLIGGSGEMARLVRSLYHKREELKFAPMKLWRARHKSAMSEPTGLSNPHPFVVNTGSVQGC